MLRFTGGGCEEKRTIVTVSLEAVEIDTSTEGSPFDGFVGACTSPFSVSQLTENLITTHSASLVVPNYGSGR